MHEKHTYGEVIYVIHFTVAFMHEKHTYGEVKKKVTVAATG